MPKYCDYVPLIFEEMAKRSKAIEEMKQSELPKWVSKPNARRDARLLVLRFLSDFSKPLPTKIILDSIRLWRKDISENSLRNQLWFLYNSGCLSREWSGRETFYSLTDLGRVCNGKAARRSCS